MNSSLLFSVLLPLYFTQSNNHKKINFHELSGLLVSYFFQYKSFLLCFFVAWICCFSNKSSSDGMLEILKGNTRVGL